MFLNFYKEMRGVAMSRCSKKTPTSKMLQRLSERSAISPLEVLDELRALYRLMEDIQRRDKRRALALMQKAIRNIGDLDVAKQQVEILITEHPEYSNAYGLMSDLEVSRHNYEAALPFARRQVELFANSWSVLNLLYILFKVVQPLKNEFSVEQRNAYAREIEAIIDIAKQLDLEPNQIVKLQEYHAKLQAFNGRLQSALRYWEKKINGAWSNEELDPHVFVECIFVAFEFGDFDKVSRYISLAAKRNVVLPKFAWFNLADRMKSEGAYYLAKMIYDSFGDDHPNSCILQAGCLWNMGLYHQAIEKLGLVEKMLFKEKFSRSKFKLKYHLAVLFCYNRMKTEMVPITSSFPGKVQTSARYVLLIPAGGKKKREIVLAQNIARTIV
jgi:tetratricopeptide (TPR) repeat protein